MANFSIGSVIGSVPNDFRMNLRNEMQVLPFPSDETWNGKPENGKLFVPCVYRNSRSPEVISAVNDSQSYHVEWLVIQDQLHSNVTVRIGDGRVIEIQPGHAANAIDLGSVAMVQGLVNAHTHLEFSQLRQPIPTTGRFTDWIRKVVQSRRENPSTVGGAIRAGIAESWQAGTTLIGEIATIGWRPQDYTEVISTEVPFQGVVFQEVLGLSPERVSQQQQLARSHVTDSHASLSRGISPHAPYSTHWDLVTAAVAMAQQTGSPLAMHLAETTAELELLAQGTGEFRELLTEWGLWHADLFGESRQPIDYLKLLAQAPRSLIIHGNYLDEESLQFLASQPQMTLVYCPRTHAAFGHTEHPWQRLVELGGQVAIGTDSRASNPDLSLFAELQFLAARHPRVSHLQLLKMGSTAGRQALNGRQSPDHLQAQTEHALVTERASVGETSIIPSDFTIIRPATSPMRDPHQELFAPGSQVCGPILQGNWIKPMLANANGPEIDR